jgi:ankyrin repeat protein
MSFNNNDFEDNFDIPDPEYVYYITPNRRDTGFKLIHKLVFFPNLLREYKITDLNEGTTSDYTPLMIAAANGIVDSVNILLKHENIDTNFTDKDDEWTALMISCAEGQIETVKLLLKHKHIDVNSQSYSGTSALMIACKNDYTEIVKLLLHHKDIDASLQDDVDRTALRFALINGYTEIVNMLVYHKSINCEIEVEVMIVRYRKDYMKHVEFMVKQLPHICNPKIDILRDIYTQHDTRIKQFQRFKSLDIGSLVYYDVKRYV